MEIYTQKAIKNLVKKGCAEDITNYGFEEMKEFLKSHDLEKVGCSRGIYGINSGLIKDESGKLYAITSRNSALLMVF